MNYKAQNGRNTVKDKLREPPQKFVRTANFLANNRTRNTPNTKQVCQQLKASTEAFYSPRRTSETRQFCSATNYWYSAWILTG